jgi:hypothetical protein
VLKELEGHLHRLTTRKTSVIKKVESASKRKSRAKDRDSSSRRTTQIAATSVSPTLSAGDLRMMLSSAPYINQLSTGLFVAHMDPPPILKGVTSGYILAAKHPENPLRVAAHVRILIGPSAALPAGSYAAGGSQAEKCVKDPVNHTLAHLHDRFSRWCICV